MTVLTSADQAEIDAETRRERELFEAVLAGEDGVRALLREEGILAPGIDGITDVLDEAEDALDDAEHTARLWPSSYQPFDLGSVRVAIDKLRGVAVAA